MRSLIPLLPTARSRRWWGRSLGPDRRWLGENGVTPTRLETIQAVGLMYLALPYVRSASQLVGWIEGRRLRGQDAQDAVPAEHEPRDRPPVD